ncbi:ZYRO0G19338p [Zygosaccharomyces rouxii]|uniref:ZYRO0G19338p n=1 Tax=Zygosaccharomyces rouxii (strain ATCC 2623 / CBS 732 / NBRC 1130 / NCYC 568 / NRRL Y-229) TaxID=559307 RepID=C5E1A5_ZYGRC|nr:uncharacterized protein ZYRO0G19338g [Zygosaccharomyces rouxii]KAH9202882.1 hypothetical protein LQ764DRAFT_55737 [Zygosaccharomyces rouxii]CAR29889.1 ZYRO0G19338p [Zygosaccharomyces rouxii]
MVEDKKTVTIRKKRKYSKLGCNECKKRKVKCDEQKPECWQCSHLGKKCVYDQPSNGPPYKSVKFINASSEDIYSIQSIYGPNTNDNDNADHGYEAQEFSNNNRAPPIQNETLALDSQFSDGDFASVLNEATELANELVTSMVDPPPMDTTLTGEHIPQMLGAQNSSTSWENISKELFMLSELELYYSRVFYHKVSFWIMPFAPSPSKNICNEVLFDLLVKINRQDSTQSSCLQSAMVSISAKYLYNTTKLKEHDAVRCAFLKKTITQLTSEFDSMPHDYLLELKIESLIICVLLLTLDSSSFKTNEMRIHLHGASVLLRKYEGLTEQGTSAFDDIMKKKCLLLAKAWFCTTETIAFISLVGTVSEECVIDDMFTLGLHSADESMLKQMGILYPNGYNIFLGHSGEVMDQLKLIMKSFVSPTAVDPYNDKFFQLMMYTDAARKFKFVDNEFAKIRIGGEFLSSYHESCYVTHKNEIYSVFDAMQQGIVEWAFIFFCMIYLKLSMHCAMIQNSSKRIWDFISWIFKDDELDILEINKLMDEIESGMLLTYDQLSSRRLNLASKFIIPEMLFDFRGMMFQPMFLICATVLQMEDIVLLRIMRIKVLAFCECLIENIGAESGKSSVELLFKRWRLLKEGKNLNAEDCLKNDGALPFS